MSDGWHAELTRVLSDARLTFIDVGARGGLLPHWVDYAPVLEVVAFEPDHEEALRLASAIEQSGAHAKLHESAVWDSVGTQHLRITESPGCSSLLPPNTSMLREFPRAERFGIAQMADLATTTLDLAIGSPKDTRAVFIKIDAQGGSLPILVGAERVLESTVGIEAEVELNPMYEGERLHGAVDEHLRPRGFELVDLRPTYWRHASAQAIPGTRGQLIFADALYVWTPARFAERLGKASPETSDHLCAAALLICDVYRLPDRIVAFAAAAEAAGVDARKRRLIESAAAAVRRRARRAVGWFPYRHRLGLWFKDIGDYLLEAPDSWANAEQRIGGRMRRANPRSRLAKTLVGHLRTNRPKS